MPTPPPDLPRTLDDLVTSAAVGKYTTEGSPPALLLTIVGGDEQDAFETQRVGNRVRMLQDAKRPDDLHVAFDDASLAWVRKRPKPGAAAAAPGYSFMVTLGRALTNDITVPTPTISTVQVSFSCMQGAYTVIDQASANGTWLNATKLRARVAEPLKSGDFLAMGQGVHALFLEAKALLAFAEERVMRRRQSRR